MTSNERIKLKIQFPKSSEDHRLQLTDINGAIFAIVDSLLESRGPIRLECPDWSLILLAPIKSDTNILISAINVVCLNDIVSKEGMVNLHASNQLIRFSQFTDSKNLCEIGERKESVFTDDPAGLLYYHRLFLNIANEARSEDPEASKNAQQQFITGLAGLADKIEKKSKNLDLFRVLDIWNIPHLE